MNGRSMGFCCCVDQCETVTAFKLCFGKTVILQAALNSILQRRYPKLFIQGVDTVLGKLCGIKVYLVNGFFIDAAPERLEFLFVKIGIQGVVFCFTAIVWCRYLSCAENAVYEGKNLGAVLAKKKELG